MRSKNHYICKVYELSNKQQVQSAYFDGTEAEAITHFLNLDCINRYLNRSNYELFIRANSIDLTAEYRKLSVHEQLNIAKVAIDWHQRDLYARVTCASKKIIKAYVAAGVAAGVVTTFTSEIDYKLWFDIQMKYTTGMH